MRLSQSTVCNAALQHVGARSADSGSSRTVIPTTSVKTALHLIGQSVKAVSLQDRTFGIIERCKSARKKWRGAPSDQNLVDFLKVFGDLENTPSTTMEGLIAKLLYATSDSELQALVTDSSCGGPKVWIDNICKSIAAIRAAPRSE
jgi:hypothetical protein